MSPRQIFSATKETMPGRRVWLVGMLDRLELPHVACVFCVACILVTGFYAADAHDAYLLRNESLIAEPAVKRALVITRQASGVQYMRREQGGYSVRYSVDDQRPGNRTLDEISESLDMEDWQAVNGPFGFPAESRTRKWFRGSIHSDPSIYNDPSFPITRFPYNWIGNWADQEGNIIRVVLRHAPGTNKIDVTLHWIPKSQVLLIEARS